MGAPESDHYRPGRAELLRGKRRAYWAGLAGVAVILGAHNLFAFYLPFR